MGRWGLRVLNFLVKMQCHVYMAYESRGGPMGGWGTLFRTKSKKLRWKTYLHRASLWWRQCFRCSLRSLPFCGTPSSFSSSTLWWSSTSPQWSSTSSPMTSSRSSQWCSQFRGAFLESLPDRLVVRLPDSMRSQMDSGDMEVRFRDNLI